MKSLVLVAVSMLATGITLAPPATASGSDRMLFV